MDNQLEYDNSLKSDADYRVFINDILTRLKVAQLRAASTVSLEVLNFYWSVGRDMLRMQAAKPHWGSKLLDQVAFDLQAANPGMSGYSRRNVAYMRLLATLYPEDGQFLKQSISQLPWSQIQLLLDKFKDDSLQ